MLKISTPRASCLGIVLAFALSACGGGGSDSASLTNPTTGSAAPPASTPVAQSATKDITAFAFTRLANGNLPSDVIATVSDTEIIAALPLGVNAASLIATFASTGANVKVDGFVQSSGSTRNNYVAPMVYSVAAQDGSSRNYTVKVVNAASMAKDFTQFSIAGASANIVGNAISVAVPAGSKTSSLVAAFAVTGVSVKVGSTVQTSGQTSNDFSAPLWYTVVAQDGSTKDYVVSVSTASTSAKALTSFSISGFTGNILGNSIAVTLPAGTDYTHLVANFSNSGGVVKVGNTVQQSGVTANNFVNPVQ
jgi:hypothetical protein